MKIFALFCLSFLLAISVKGEETSRSAGVIGHMDSVEIRVFREDDLTVLGQLSESGSISMPLIGSVRIQGLNTEEAARLIEAKLRDGFLVKPEVSVTIEARIKRTVTVLGQAQRPGVFELPANRRLTLVEAVGMAGGVTRIGNPKKISLKREGKVTVVNLKEISAGRGRDMILKDGDVITIPESLF